MSREQLAGTVTESQYAERRKVSGLSNRSVRSQLSLSGLSIVSGSESERAFSPSPTRGLSPKSWMPNSFLESSPSSPRFAAPADSQFLEQFSQEHEAGVTVSSHAHSSSNTGSPAVSLLPALASHAVEFVVPAASAPHLQASANEPMQAEVPQLLSATSPVDASCFASEAALSPPPLERAGIPRHASGAQPTSVLASRMLAVPVPADDLFSLMDLAFSDVLPLEDAEIALKVQPVPDSSQRDPEFSCAERSPASLTRALSPASFGSVSGAQLLPSLFAWDIVFLAEAR
jgi:hypothetical protein